MVQGIFGVEIIMLIQWDGKKVIADYIRNQLEEDYASDQISLKEYMDPFTGSERKWAKKTAARERLPEIVMRCQASMPLRGVKPVIVHSRDCANHQFTGGYDLCRFCIENV